MARTKIAPTLAKAVGGSIHAADWPALRRELRALLAVARAAGAVFDAHEEDIIPVAKWNRATRALARLRSVSAGKRGSK